MRPHRIAILAFVVALLIGSAAACNALLGISGGTARPAVTQLSAGNAFACALLADGTVWCWGADDHQQLGHIDLDADVPCPSPAADGGFQLGLCSPTPLQVVGLSGVTQIAVGSDFACALVTSGTVYCWGSNGAGQLGPFDAGEFSYAYCPRAFFEGGTGPVAPQCTPVPKIITGLPTANSITAGIAHVCASTDKGVYCWGNDGPIDTPVLVKGVPKALQLAAPIAETALAVYDDNTCALISPHATMCWGPGGTMEGCDGLICTLETSDVSSVHLGVGFGCTLGSSGSLECWGEDTFFTFDPMNPGPQQTPTSSDYTELLEDSYSATATLFDGRTNHVLVVDQTGRLFGWGDNTYGQLATLPAFGPSACNTGLGSCEAAPVEVTLGDGGAVRAIATGNGFSLALTSDGTVWGWGANAEGQLGYVSDGGACMGPNPAAPPCNWVPSAIQVPP